jgi:putative transposase
MICVKNVADLAERKGNRLLVENIDCLRYAFDIVKTRHPFRIDAVVILPDHLHCIWTLPPKDTDFSVRWGLIKVTFSRAIEKGERISQSRQKRGERGFWQRRFWEHRIRDEADFHDYIDYIHWNQVKHGWVRQVVDLPYFSFQAYLERGVYTKHWSAKIDLSNVSAGE